MVERLFMVLLVVGSISHDGTIELCLVPDSAQQEIFYMLHPAVFMEHYLE